MPPEPAPQYGSRACEPSEHIWRFYKLDEDYQRLDKCARCGDVSYAEPKDGVNG